MANKIESFKRGKVKETTYQAKKHYTQMTESELGILGQCLNGIQKLNQSKHLKEKIEAKEVLLEVSKLYDTLHRPDITLNIIEYNETYSDYRHRIEQRVLVRLASQRMVNIKGQGRTICNTFVVINLTTKTIITSYLNAADDKHSSIDMRRYFENLEVRNITAGGFPLSKWQTV